MAVTDPSPVIKKGAEPQVGSTKLKHIETARSNFGTIKRHKPRKTEDIDSESLSDIDDFQVSGYFNNKADMQYKKVLWEALNKQYTNKPKPKRTTEAKKRGPAKKAKTGEKVEVQKLSSKINYDALKALEEEELEEVAPTIGADSSSYQAGV